MGVLSKLKHDHFGRCFLSSGFAPSVGRTGSTAETVACAKNAG